MTTIAILDLLCAILLALCFLLTLALVMALAGYRPTLLERSPDARSNSSSIDPTGAPALAFHEDPTTVDPTRFPHRATFVAPGSAVTDPNVTAEQSIPVMNRVR